MAAKSLDPTPRYEDSRLDTCVYELHVWLLAADRRSVIAQHHVAPQTSGRGPPGCWVQVRLLVLTATPDMYPKPSQRRREVEGSRVHGSLIRTPF